MALTKIPASLLSGVDLLDSVRVNIGSDNDLALFHTGANGVIHNTTGALRIRANTLNIQDYTNEDAMITANSNGSVDLYHNNQKKFETSSTGATVTGVLTATSVNTGQGDYELYAMDQNVRTTDSPAFAAATINGTLTVTGDLDITGDINSYNVTDLDVTDKTITLGAGQTEANSGGSGIIIDGSSASILWDETNDVFDINKGLTTLGNVGIGTDSPTKSLSVKAPSGSNGGIDVFHNNGNKVAELVHHGSGDEGRLSLYDGGVGTVQLHGESGQPSYINSGNVGIGTTNPGNKLEIQHGTIGTGNGSNNTLALRYNSTTLYGQHYMDANGLYHIRADGQGVAGGNLILGGDTSVQIWTGSTPESRVTVDSSGLVGIGCTPDAWSGYSVLQIGTAGSLSANEDVTFLSANGYSSASGWKYVTTDEASLYQQQSGEHIWYGAASGSADAAISWSERMRILSSGNLVVGDTSLIGTNPTGSALNIFGDGITLRLDGSGNATKTILFRGTSAGNPGEIYADGGLRLRTEDSGMPIMFHTNSTGSNNERMRIDSSGQVGINDTNPSQMLSVSGTGSVAPARFTATGNTNTLEVWGNATASTSTGLLCNAGTNEFDYSAKFRNYAGSTIMEVRGDSVIDIFGTTRLQDNTILALGQSSDARIYYDGTDSLYITASNGTANTVNITANNFQIGGATPLISGTANDSVVINQDGASNVDFRVESDNEQYNFFCDASSEIIHFGEGTNSDVQSVIPARTLAGRRHGYHGGNKQHTGQTFKYSEGTSWTDAIKIDWHNVSWGAVCMRITGQYYYGASNNFSIVIGFQGYGEVNNSSYGSTSVSYDATSSGVETWTNAIQLAQTATGETTIRQRAGDSTGDIIYRYEWQCYARSNQPILILDL